MTTYYGHTHKLGTPQNKLHWQPLWSHAYMVALRAGTHAQPFGETQCAFLMGTLHDLGKYGDSFQRRLERPHEVSGLDHWSIGAIFAKSYLKDPALTLCIQGHHIGLQRGDTNTLTELTAKNLTEKHSLELRLTEPDLNVLIPRLKADGFALPPKVKASALIADSAAAMLDTRMLFSALVDADYLDTEAAMRMPDAPLRPTGLNLDAPKAVAALEKRLAELGQNPKLPHKTRELRRDLMDACTAAGQQSGRRWTLTAPTGSGKTLAMLRFALTRAAQDRRIRRIVVVLPFLSILDQTVDEYRKVFPAAEFGEDFVLEHHSLAGTQRAADDGQQEQQRDARFLTQNWDAPIIVTTSVQLLESLHSGHPGTCRKLHRLAGSVLLLDEVQTLPTALAVTTLKTLSRLSNDKYGAVVVMATATQPAFDTLHEAVNQGEPEGGGWQPQEIAPPELRLFERSRRVRPTWHLEQVAPWEEVEGWLRRDEQGLCIVNLKAHALALAQRLKDVDGLAHLSTSLCPEHRRKALKLIRQQLKEGQPCRVVATQCVEAGVDLDFPLVIRALAPLDSIVQAAGRCNRHALREFGELRVFLPEEEKYPGDTYKRAAQLARTLWKEGALDLEEAQTFRRYYKRLWQYEDTDKAALAEAILGQDYLRVAELYRLIPKAAVNVVVPYGEGVALMDEAANDGIDAFWMRRVQPYTVSVFPDKNGKLPAHCQPVNYKQRGKEPKEAEDWFICPDPKTYNDTLFGYLPDGGGAEPFSL
ncbi:CRISPR-associated helicase Cas3' [Deinococcus sp.]|uniref:CRISPR-associated helicase Cas3' n=1 Tax=Deinococcus sp. TaxID=47478 RepID=UPI003B5A3BAF